MKILKSPPPQNPICHSKNDINATKAVRTIEKRNMDGLLNNPDNNRLNNKP